MAVNYQSVAEKIFRVLKGSGLSLKMFDNQEGGEVANPEQARFFYVQTPNIMVNLDDKNGEIKMHKGPSDINEIQKIVDLLRNLSKTSLLDFDLREFGREIKPKNYAFRLNTNTMTDNIQTESLSGLIGTVKTSSQKLENAKLLIKHRKPVDEEVPGSRSRNISALYIENVDGERFKYPFIHLNGARAMTRHVQSGGTPYDEVGQSVINMSEQLSKIREVLTIMRRSPAVQEQAASVMGSMLVRQDRLREMIKRITSVEGYKNYTENFVAKVNAEVTPDAINSMKEKFTVTNVDNRIQELIPMINEIHDEENTLDKLRIAVQTKLAQPIEMMPPKPIDITDMPIRFINDRTKIAARLNLVGKLVKDDEISIYLDRMAAKLQGSDKEPAGGEAAEKAGDMAPYRKDDIQVIMKVLDDAKVKALIKQVETEKTDQVANAKMTGTDESEVRESELPEFAQLDENFNQMLGMFASNVIATNEEEDPKTNFTKWLKDKYNKTPRDLSADEYAKMSKEFQEQMKKDESELNEEEVTEGFKVGDTVLPKEEGPGQAPGRCIKVEGDKCTVKFADGSTETFAHNELEATDAKNLPEADGKDHDDDGDVDSDDYMAAKDKAIKKAMGNKQEAVDVDAPAKRDALKNKYANILKPIAQQEDFSGLYDLTSDYKNDELFTYLHDKMNDIMADHGLHPKDNMEDIEMRLMDELKDDYGIAEASELDIMKKNAGIQSEEAKNEADASDMFKSGGKYSQTAQNKPVMHKGKQIDLDTVEYDMQDYSDMIFEPELGMKYTDGTEVADDDIADLMDNDDFVEWVRIDYMDKQMDRADMMRDGTESELDIMKKNAGIQSEEEVVEGGNDFDIAMGEAESIISDASSDEQAKADLQKLHDMQDDSYAKSTVADYIARLEKEGLSAMQRELAMADMAGESTQEAIDPQAQTNPELARMKELISYKV